MQNDVKERLTRSSELFRDIVWPAISSEVGGGIIEPVESVTSEGFVKILDTLSGVDAWQVIQGRGVRAIASRVQDTFCDMGTLTIRKTTSRGSDDTEFAKIGRIVKLWDKGFLSAGLVVQAYLKDPACAYIIRASDFYPRIDLARQGRRLSTKSCSSGLWFEQPCGAGQTMAVFPVQALMDDGCRVLRVPINAGSLAA